MQSNQDVDSEQHIAGTNLCATVACVSAAMLALQLTTKPVGRGAAARIAATQMQVPQPLTCVGMAKAALQAPTYRSRHNPLQLGKACSWMMMSSSSCCCCCVTRHPQLWTSGGLVHPRLAAGQKRCGHFSLCAAPVTTEASSTPCTAVSVVLSLF